ncbi:UDP-N-acetylglucosamine--LPS N-acetylglucosamine transferase [Chlorogloeopsis sp. ULAP01]|uniref:UDP-N-acetylglucosamine--LPS N-acetylglucosamine transferase n=1 Tax=Chlorogloeopsis sp. ULAP01 TaxID=3056483 RepID=UPI0025AA7A8F|nr:UDP-N-acetylglucosamine--LPS N-acetylglucosamine transferase [Chlorogloeopsis sp. ULAP01]MDM9384397.1 UDP-N-acetylglucosamine--LPS N-acetylglucosamine transferase [Chlorogloeopsis sp. ULAP01]
MTNWLIYALGGGWGHLTRALSLGRIAATQTKVTIITNSPYAKILRNEGCLLHQISHELDFNATCEQVRQILLNTHYDCLIVDTFPRGLGGELADILPQLHKIPRILIHRDINPIYVTTKNLHSFVAANFDLTLVPGEGKNLPFCDLPNIQHTAPWLIRNRFELPNTTIARSHLLKVNHSAKIILVCAAGLNSELPFYSNLALELHEIFDNCAVRILAASCPPECPQDLWISHHPGIECLAAADVVVGGGGYNTVYECAAVGVPLVAFAFKRLYDRQHKRVSVVYPARNIADAVETLRKVLDRINTKMILSVPDYINGAVQAVRLIEGVLNVD